MIALNVQEFYQQLAINKPLIGIDYGRKKIGIAISDHNLSMAMPHKTIINLSCDQQILEILKIIRHLSAGGLVIGLPINMNNTESQQTLDVRRFALKLDFVSFLPCFMQDERLSTKAAHSLLRSHGFNRKERDEIDDSLSASMILQTSLDSISRFRVRV